MRKLLYLLVPCLLIDTCLFGQSTATLSGHVSDPSSARVAGARVTTRNEQTASRATSDTDPTGFFVFPNLQPGRYRVSVEKAGFTTAVREGVELNVAGVASVDFTLELGEPSTTVNVHASRTAIERDVIAVNSIIDRSFVENLPLNGRSFQSLLELSPGVVTAKAGTVSAGQFSVNGQRTNSNYFTVDGVGANVAASTAATFSQQAAGTLPGLTVLGGTNSLVILDALQEFRISTSIYSPEFGRQPGAQVQLLTRSGANRAHGSLFYEFRNEKLDANDWFTNAAGRGRSPFRLNQFGGTFSGPVVAPKLYRGQDRTFFFLAYEGLRLRQPRFDSVQVPSTYARNRATGAVRQLLNAFPLPNAVSPFTSPDEGLLQVSYSDPAANDIGSVRLDHRLSDNVQAFFRASLSRSVSISRTFANQMTATASNLDTYTGGLNWSLTPRLFHETRFNYSRSIAGFDWEQGVYGGAVRLPDELIFPGYASRDVASAGIQLGVFLPGISPPNLTQGRSIGNRQEQFNLVDSLSWVRGTHQFKFGADVRVMRPTADFRQFGVSYNFGSITRAIDQGTVATMTVQALAPRGKMMFPSYSFFAQDTWRATPRLTLTYGFRWEFVPPPSTDRERPIYRLDQTDNLLTAVIAPKGSALWSTRANNIGPRGGLSYLVSQRHGLVFKAGTGVFHDLGTGQASRGFNSWPYNTVRSTSNARFPAAAASLEPLPFNTAAPYSSDFYFNDAQFRQPYTIQWSAGFEKSLGTEGVVDVRYVANAGRRLLFTEYLRNRPAVPAQGLAENTVINPIFGTSSNVNLTSNRGESDYHSLQAQYRRRAARGLQVQLSYTYSKSIDNSSDETNRTGPTNRVNPSLDRAPSDFDVRHNLSAAVTYELPRTAPGMAKGWAVDTIVRARSATPVNIISGSDPLNVGLTTIVRPDRILGVPLYVNAPEAPGGRRINAQAFRNPTDPRQGSLGRNSLRGLSIGQVDFAARREFMPKEGLRIQFRAELYNIFNHPNFADPSGTLYSGTQLSPAFGLSQSMLGRSLSSGSGGLSPLFQIGGPRSVQFALKMMF